MGLVEGVVFMMGQMAGRCGTLWEAAGMCTCCRDGTWEHRGSWE